MRRPLRGLLVAAPTLLACVALRLAFSVSVAAHGQEPAGAMRRRHVTSTSQRGSLQSSTSFFSGTPNIDDASIAPADVTLAEGSGVFISTTKTTDSLEASASDSASAVTTASPPASSSESWTFSMSTTPFTTASSTTTVSGLPSTTLSFDSASSIELSGSVTSSLSTTHSSLSTGLLGSVSVASPSLSSTASPTNSASLSLTSSTSTSADTFLTASSSSSQSFSSQTSLSNTPSSSLFPSLSSTITFTLFPSEADTHTTSPSLSSTTPVTSATSTVSPADGSATFSSSSVSSTADHSPTTLVDGEGVTPPPDSTVMPSEGDAQPWARAGVVLSQEGSPNMTPIPLLPVSAKKGEDFWHNSGAVAATFLVAALVVGGVIFGLGLYLHSRKKQRYDRVSAHGEPHLEPPNFASGPPVSPFCRDPYSESDHGQSDTYQPLVLNEAVGQKLMHGWRPPRRSSTVYTDAPSVYSQDSPTSGDGEFDPYRDFAAAASSGAGTTSNPLPAGAPIAKGPTFASPPSSSLGPARQTAAGNGANLISTKAEMMAQGPPPRYASPYVPDRYLSTHIEESEPDSNDDHEARTRSLDDGGFTDEPARVRLLQDST